MRLHDWLGVWTLLALLVLIASGLYLAQPGWMEPALTLLPGAQEAHAADQGACRQAIFDTAGARSRSERHVDGDLSAR